MKLALAVISVVLVGCASGGTGGTAPRAGATATAPAPSTRSSEPVRSRSPVQIVEEAARRMGLPVQEATELPRPEGSRWRFHLRKLGLGCALKLLQQVEQGLVRVRTVELQERWVPADGFDLSFEVRGLMGERLPTALRRDRRDPYASVTPSLHMLLHALHLGALRRVSVRPDQIHVKGDAPSHALVEQIRQRLAEVDGMDHVTVGRLWTSQAHISFSFTAAVKHQPRSVRPFTATCAPVRPAPPASAPAPHLAAPSSQPGPVNAIRWIRKVGANRWLVDRKHAQQVLADTRVLATSARIVPSVEHGKTNGFKFNGFKLFSIRAGSVFDQMGLRNGDTVHAILGIPLTSPDAALNAYAKIVKARRITIALSRRGTRMTHEYVVR